MAIQWGAWQYSGGNGMRVGIDVSVASVSHGSSSVKFTVRYYTQNQYSYNDSQSMSFGGAIGGSTSFTNNSGSGTIRRATRTYTYNYGNNEYGSSPGNRTFSASISGAYNGVTPSKSVSVKIPARPIAHPRNQDNVTATRLSDSTARITWERNIQSGRPYEAQDMHRWDNVSNSWTNLSNMGANATSSDRAISGNRRYRFRLRAKNSAGWSAWAGSNYIQTTPAAPSNCSVSKTSVSSVIVRWSNGASTTNGYAYNTLLEEQVDGGAWTQVATVGAGVTSHARLNRTPGSVYRYRVRARSTVGDTTYSAYSTSDTIQLQSPPAAPTVVSTVRTNDNSFTLNWTNNPNGTLAPYTSLTVQRWDSVSQAWGTIGSLPAEAVSLTDTSTVVDRRYEWRIRANNAAGSSEWVDFTPFQTRPAAPVEVRAKAAPGGSIEVTWINAVSYDDYSILLRHYKDGVLVAGEVGIAAGETTYVLEDVTLTSSYQFEVRAVSEVGYVSQSEWTSSSEMSAATVPEAPADLTPNGTVVDVSEPWLLSWTHVPSLDASDQTAFQFGIRESGAVEWDESAEVASPDEFWLEQTGAFLNGTVYEWRVRTKGVHPDWSPWSSVATFTTSRTPVITISEPASGSLEVSQLKVAWTYSDEEGTAQSSWTVELYNSEGDLLEQKQGNDESTSTTMSTVIVDGESYHLRVRVRDGDGLRSEWAEVDLFANFLLPAAPTLAADYSQESGVTVLTLTPTEVEPGITLPPTGVDVQRRLLNQDTQVFGPWETLAEGVSADATLIDTTAPIANDGEYRTITYSAAPSAVASPEQPPSGADDRWVYLSGGSGFTQVCRLMGNVALRTTASRERSLYHFAGRRKPVMFAGDARNRVIDVAGLLDGESSSPAEWEHLIESCDVLLLRDPLGHRMYGSVPQVAIDFLGNDMYAISFTVTEVSYP